MTGTTNLESIDKIMVTLDQMDKVARFTGHDFEGKTSRRARPTASPEFTVIVDNDEGERSVLEAVIVASNVPQEETLPLDEPLAIAMIRVDDIEYFLLINGDRTLGDRLIQYEGDPEELFRKTHLFDNE
jgi:hypothetical protein